MYENVYIGYIYIIICACGKLVLNFKKENQLRPVYSAPCMLHSIYFTYTCICLSRYVAAVNTADVNIKRN